jgi:hypothetical protein
MSQYFMAFDAETGGLDPNKADLLTVYFCIMDEEFKMQDELYLKLKPDNGRLPIAESQALKVNGIDIKKHLEDPETITYSDAKVKVIVLLKKYLKKHGKYSNIVPLGFNVLFDVKWCQEHLIPKNEWESMIHYQEIDVMKDVGFLKRAKWFPQDIGNLGSVVDFLQVPKRGVHNAREDTLMTIDVYKRVLNL